MQVYLHFSVHNLTLSLAYSYPLQSLLYRLMYPDPAYSAQVHDTGHSDGHRAFKLFCFGPLMGPHRVDRDRKEITFFSEVLLEVRTPDPRLAVVWRAVLEPGLELELRGQPLVLDGVEADQQAIAASPSTIQAVSPILAYRSYEAAGVRRMKCYPPWIRSFRRWWYKTSRASTGPRQAGSRGRWS